LEDLAGKPSPWYGEVEAISGDGTSSVLKRGTPSAVLLRKYGSIRACAKCTEDACIFDFVACAGVSDLCLLCVIDMVEKFLP